MGYIHHHEIENIKNKYGTNIFIETGTWLGDGLNYAKQFDFKELYSVELLENYFEDAKKRFENSDNIFLFQGNSADKIIEILTRIDKNDTILFWLDAHLPNFYTDVDYDKNLLFPLEIELKNILECRPNNKDYFIIDDLRIYEDGNYESGNCPSNYKCDNSLDFIYHLFENTHYIVKDYRVEGYLIFIPKKEIANDRDSNL